MLLKYHARRILIKIILRNGIEPQTFGRIKKTWRRLVLELLQAQAMMILRGLHHIPSRRWFWFCDLWIAISVPSHGWLCRDVCTNGMVTQEG